MSLVKSFDNSNAADPNSSTDPMTGSVGMTGFTKMPYPTQKPAMSNADVGVSLRDSIGSLGNDGTNMSAYKEQKTDITAEKGE